MQPCRIATPVVEQAQTQSGALVFCGLKVKMPMWRVSDTEHSVAVKAITVITEKCCSKGY